MSLTFPASPTVGDTYTVGARTWTWSGTIWEITGTVAAAGSIGTTELADSAVTTAKIAAGAVTEADIADGAVTTAKIAAGAVVEADIASNAVTAEKLGTDVQLGYRNVIINGAMQVAQRGTSTAGITSGAPILATADRWGMVFTTASEGTWTNSLENDAPSGSGLRKSYKVLCTTAKASLGAGDALSVRHAIEGQNVQQFLKGTASAKPFTLSFWVKSNVTGTFTVRIADVDNSRQVASAYTISASGTWEKKTITFPADTTGMFDNDNAASLILVFRLLAGTDFTSGTLQTTWAATSNSTTSTGQTNLAAATSNYWQITGVQLEAGAVATPFEFEDYGTTLAKCQRYYQRITGLRNFGLMTAQTSTDAYGLLPLPVSMRVSPTSVDSNTLRAFDLFNAATTISALTLESSSSESYAATKIVTTGMTTFRTYYVINNGATSYLGFSAEL